MEGVYNSSSNMFNWVNLPNNIDKYAGSVSSILVSPIQNAGKDVIYATFYNLETTFYQQVGDLSGGIFKSSDGGLNWTLLISNKSISINPEQNHFKKVISDPTNANVLVAITEKYIYRTTNGGTTWTKYSPAIPPDNGNFKSEFIDIDINLSNSNKYYACTNSTLNSPCQLWTIDFGLSIPTWQKYNNLSDLGNTKLQLDFSSLEPNSIFICYTDINNGNTVKIKKSIDNGNTWTITNSFTYYDWGVAKFAFAISETDINIKYIGSNTLHRIDFNSDLYEMTTYEPNYGISSTHADIRDIQIKSLNNNDVIIIGHDGGLARTVNGLYGDIHSWINLNGSTLSNSEFYHFDYFPSNSDVVGGLQDNGTLIMENETWTNNDYLMEMGDGWGTLVNKENENIVYNVINSKISKSNNRGKSFDTQLFKISGEGNDGKSDLYPFPTIIDPINSSVIWAGEDNLYKFDTKTNTKTLVWSSSTFGNVFGGQIKSIAISPTNNNIIYLGFYFPQWGDYLNKVKLLRSVDGGITFSDITIHTPSNNPFNYNGLTDIIVDPYNPNHIFVSFYTGGGTSNAAKVFEVTINGTTNTWNDLSNGFGINERIFTLHYLDGSNGIVFAGTNNGVYKLDYSQSIKQWVLYGTGMPNTIISQIKANPCRNKLIVSTFGRGIWETDLPTINKQADIIINTNQTWSSFKKIYSNVFVKSGAKLTVNANVSFEKDNFLIIEPGASVYINGAKLYSTSGCKWGGILVEGNPSKPQNPITNQGYISLTNGAIIEGAKNAISTASYNFVNGSSVSINWTKTGGGIIIASNATLRKNSRHIEFMSYKNRQASGVENKNVSRFTNCTFEMEGSIDLNIPTNRQSAMVTAWDVKDVTFTACDFKNINGSINVDKPSTDRGRGIYTLDASVTVTGTLDLNCNIKKLGTFTDLSTGVDNVWSPGATTKMSEYKHLKFELNDKSIRLANGNTTTIYNNTFDLNVPDRYYNKFASANTLDLFTGIAGIYAHNSGAFLVERNNYLYNPSLFQLNSSIIISNVLRFTDKHSTGGRIRLNTHNNVYIGDQTQEHNAGLTITCNKYIGSGDWGAGINLNPNTTTSNLPSFGNCGNQNTRFDYKNGFKSNITFDIANYSAIFLPNYVVEPSAIDIPIKVLGVNVTNCGASSQTVKPKEPCTISTGLGCGEVVKWSDFVTKSKQGFTDSKNGLKNTEQALASGTATDIAKVDLLNDKNFYERELQVQRGNVLWNYNAWEMADSNVNATDSIIAFLSTETDIASKKLLAAAYYGANKLELAQQTLLQIPANDDENTQFKTYYQLLIQANLNNRNIFMLTESELNSLEEMANTNTGAALAAQGILTLVQGRYYNTDIIEKKPATGELGKMATTITQPALTDSLPTQKVFSVYPNPANGIIKLSYELPNTDNNQKPIYLMITNLSGKVFCMKKIEQPNPQDVIEIETKNWAEGMYFIEFRYNKRSTIQKVSIIH